MASSPRRAAVGALAMLLGLAGCNINQRLLLSVTDVPEAARAVELQIIRASDGADSREALSFTPNRSADRTGNAFTVGLYLARDGERYTVGAAARDAQGCVLATQIQPVSGDVSDSSLALQPFTPDAVNAALPRVCTATGPALRDLQSSAKTVDEYTLRGWGFGAGTQIKLAALPDSTARDGYLGCAPSAAGCSLEGSAQALRGAAPDVVTRVDQTALTLRGTHLSSASGAIGLCALVYEAGALRTCAPVMANLLQFEQQSVDLGVDFHPGYLSVADLNQDGRPDLALAGGLGQNGDQGGGVVVLLNQASGPRFAVQRAPAPADTSAPYARLDGMIALLSAAGVAAADLDLDGHQDLLVGESGQGRVVVLRGGPGGPRPGSQRLNIPAGAKPEVSLAADLNSDNKPDVVVVNDPLGVTAGQITLLLNQLNLRPDLGALSFVSSSYEVGLAPVFATTISLTRGLGPDLLITGIGLAGEPGAMMPAGGVYLLRSQVAASGQTERLYPNVPRPGQPEFYPTGFYLGSVAAGDVDGDGLPDALVAGNAKLDGSGGLSTEITLFRGSPLPQLPSAFAAARRLPAGTAPFSVAIGDLDGDQQPDLAVANALDGRRGSLTVLLNQGQGAFPSGGLPRFVTGDDSSVVALADFDQDGRLDIVVVSQGHKDKNALSATAGAINLYLNRISRRQPVP